MDSIRVCSISWLVLLLAPFGNLPEALGATPDELIQKVITAARLAHDPPGYNSDASPYGSACSRAVDEAISGGISPNMDIKLQLSIDEPWVRLVRNDDEEYRVATLADIKTHICVAAFAKGYLDRLAQDGARADTWAEEVTHQTAHAGLGKDFGERCLRSTEAALKAGVSTSVEIELAGSGKRFLLGEMKEKVCLRAISAGTTQMAKNQAAAAARIEPYVKVITGDKLRIFKDSPIPGYQYYTSGKRVIETPQDLASSRVWCFEGVENQGYLHEKWTVHCWKFDSSGQQVKEYRKSGYGVKAPASAFPSL